MLLWGVLVRTLGIPFWVTVAVALPACGVLGVVFVALRAPQTDHVVSPGPVDLAGRGSV